MYKKYKHVETGAIVQAVPFDAMMADCTGETPTLKFLGNAVEVVHERLCVVETPDGMVDFPRGELLIVGKDNALSVCLHNVFADLYTEATGSAPAKKASKPSKKPVEKKAPAKKKAPPKKAGGK